MSFPSISTNCKRVILTATVQIHIESASKFDSTTQQRLWSRGYDSRLGLSQDIKCERSQVRVLATACSFAFCGCWVCFGEWWLCGLEVSLGKLGSRGREHRDRWGRKVCQGGSQESRMQRLNGWGIKTNAASPSLYDIVELRWLCYRSSVGGRCKIPLSYSQLRPSLR